MEKIKRRLEHLVKRISLYIGWEDFVKAVIVIGITVAMVVWRVWYSLQLLDAIR